MRGTRPPTGKILDHLGLTSDRLCESKVMTPPEHHVVGINPIYKSGFGLAGTANSRCASAKPGRPPMPRRADHPVLSGPRQREMLYAALHHDCGELITGDVPSPTADANPALRAALSQAEADARLSMGIVLRGRLPMLRFADRLRPTPLRRAALPPPLGQPEMGASPGRTRRDGGRPRGLQAAGGVVRALKPCDNCPNDYHAAQRPCRHAGERRWKMAKKQWEADRQTRRPRSSKGLGLCRRRWRLRAILFPVWLIGMRNRPQP